MARAIELLNDKIVRYLREMELNVRFRRDCFELHYGRALATITPIELTEDRSTLRLLFYILFEVPVDERSAIYRELSALNDRYTFGRFYLLVPEENPTLGTIVADINFLGEYLDYPVFSGHLHMIGSTADELVPVLKEKFGGLSVEEFFARRDAEAAARAQAEAASAGQTTG